MTAATPTAPAKLMTAEEFVAWSERPENAGRRCELEAGRVIDVPPPSRIHGRVCGWVGHLFWQYIASQGRHGEVLTNDTGLVVGPDAVRGPDVTVYARAEPDAPGPATAVPDLIVEVFSPSDRLPAMLRRIAQYHAFGVPVVWVLHPDDLAVSVHRPDRAAETADGPAVLTVPGLPGFSCRAEELFVRPNV